ncbi:MAG: CBS domain-containing protein [Alphaproteobacteria bacterium]|jgi:CBS domain-containing protein|nr:CBS domain-containing protein [Alphaproteobacteria bacterium]MDP6812644.1 CBS domain-containing protein [Alphaproteobacteria bacterium]
MRAKDIMTTEVVTVTPGSSVENVAQVLLDKNISGVPVTDDGGNIVGMVSEGDLLRRVELGGEQRRSWWLSILSSPEEDAQAFVKSHGRIVADIMTKQLVSVDEDTSVAEVARLLEKNHIKRMPVMRGDSMVGIVSRANVLQALASHRDDGPAAPTAGDRGIRSAVLAALQSQQWVSHGAINVLVTDGVVEIWGWVETEAERRAMLVAAEEIAGVQKVIDHLAEMPPGT